MNKRVRRFLLQVFSSLNALFLTFQPLAALPVLLANPVVVQAEASVSADAVDLAFDAGSHEFQLRVKTDQALPYVLTYLDEKQDPQVEQAAQGNLEKMEGSVFGADVYAGTCSGEVCTPITFLTGSLQVGGSYKTSWTYNNGVITLESSANEDIVCLEPDAQRLTAGDTLWSVDETLQTAETKTQVRLGVAYQFPLDDKVSVTFTCLPKDESLRSSLKMQQVAIDELALPDSVITDSKYAYDITTDMADGTFKYELTLPKEEGQTAEVTYIEKTLDEAKQEVKTDEVKTVEQKDEVKIEQQTKGEDVKVEGLDHFTIFVVVYDSFPAIMPGSYPSVGFQATSTYEFGDHLALAGTERVAQRITVEMTNWACENDFTYANGAWVPNRGNSEACITTPGASYTHPLTLNVYSVDTSGAVPVVGSLILTKTIAATIPFRPSYGNDQRCTAPENDAPFGGTWFDPVSQGCVHGYNFDAVFDLDGQTLPDQVIVAVAFNTQSYGVNPIGQNGPYNSLNMSVGPISPSTGMNVNPDDVFWDTTYAPFYTDGGASGVGILRQDTNWTGYVPVIKVETSSPSTTGRCGDGSVNQKSEQCDDGNQDGVDYCNNQCQFNQNVCLADVNMVVNGDFENSTVTKSQGWDIFNMYSPNIGWSADWNSIPPTWNTFSRPEPPYMELHLGSVIGWTPDSGAQYTELDTDWFGPDSNTSGEPASIQLFQNLATIPGNMYEVTFAYSPRPNANGNNNQMVFEFGSNSESYGPEAASLPNWTTVTKTLSADSSTTMISFTDTGVPQDGEGMLLDNVSVKCLGPAPTTSSVTVCKEDNNGNKLPGWSMLLKGEVVQTGLSVPTNSSAGVNSVPLDADIPYIAEASGTWTNQGGANPVDAEYSTTDGWASQMDGYTGYQTDILELQINSSFDPNSNWGTYNSNHKYVQSFIQTATGSANFRIFDGTGTTQNESWFGDNEGSLSVDISKGFAGITDKDGCVTFDTVPYGSYTLGEVMQDGWEYSDGNAGSVEIDNESATFTLRNKVVPTPTPVSDVTVCKQDHTNAYLSGWNVSLKGELLQTLEVPPTGESVVSTSLPTDNYVLEASGMYTYRPGTAGAEYTDANYSKRHPSDAVYGGAFAPWVNVNSFPAPYTGWLGLMVNDNPTNWSAYFAPDHVYTLGYPAYAGSTFAFKMLDDQYGDNSGNLTAKIFKGYAGTTGDKGCVTFTDVPYGNYMLDEVVKDGWEYLDGGRGEVKVSDESVTFTLRNKEIPTKGNIIVQKTTIPAGDTTAFSISATGTGTITGGGDGSVTDGLDQNYTVTPGTYSVVETEVDNWIITANTCTDIVVTAGETKTCEITNTKQGSLTIVKDTNPNNAQDFVFTPTGNGINTPFTLDDDADATLPNSWNRNVLGTYTFYEKPVDGWALLDIVCTGATTWTKDLSGRLLSVTVNPGEVISCTFTNIPVYSGSNSCPAEAPVKVLKSEHTINSTDADGEVLAGVMGGSSYLFEVSGTFVPTSPANGWNSDAGYTTTDSWANLNTQYGLPGPAPDYGAHALLSDLGNGVGIVQWGSYNPAHVYSLYYTPTVSDPQFVIGDRWSNWYGTPWDNQGGVGDNAGSLNLKVYECMPYGSIEGSKFEDVSGNGVWDGADTRIGWTFFLKQNDQVVQTATTSGNQKYLFENLMPGTYQVCEAEDAGWTQTYPATNSKCHDEVVVSAGQKTDDIDFGNFIESRLYILKTNDAWPTDVTIGDEVTYTIRVMAVGGPVYDATVLDVPPAQLAYVPDSYTAESSDGTDLRADGTTGDPNYQSPGKWTLGDLAKDEIITLTYKAKVGSLADPGVYPDMVWATGTSEQSRATEGETDDLLALSDPEFDGTSGEVTFDGALGHFGEDNFAGTQVAIVADQTPFSEYQVGRTEEKQGVVLGASTELPATGARAWLTVLAFLNILAGAGFLIMGKRSRNSGLKALLGLFVVGFSLWFAQPAQALTSVRVEEPYNNSAEFTLDAITNQTTMKVDFVVLNTDNLSVTAQCQQQKNDGAWNNIITNYTVKAGGNSGYCEAKDLENTQNYDFRVVVSGDGPDKISDEVRVGLDTNRPDKPVNYSKNPGNYCEDKIGFKTANDGQTTSVEVYRSTDSDHFTAKPETRVTTIPIGPNQEYTLTTSKPNCDDTYYYVIRAFDVNGNASDLVGDQEIKTVTIESASGTSQTVQLGAIPAGSAFIGGDTAGGSTTGEKAEDAATTEDEATTDETTTEPTGTESTDGSVLGSATESLMSFLTRFGLPIGVGLIVLAGLYVIFFGKRNEK